MKIVVGELAKLIEKAGRSQRVIEVECPYVPGFFVKVAYLSKFILNQIRETARERYTNARNGQKEERMNEEKLREAYVDYVVLTWRGLTLSGLLRLTPSLEIQPEKPGDAVDLSTPVDFDKVIASAILKSSLEFENWVVSVASDLENYSALAEQKKKESENLA